MTTSDLPYGPFEVGRGVLVNGRMVTTKNDGAEAGFDLSSGRWQVRIRSYEDRAATRLVHNLLVAADAGTEGYFLDTLPAWTTPYPNGLWWEEVRVDTQVNDAGTPSGKSEIVTRRWQQPILDAPNLPPA